MPARHKITSLFLVGLLAFSAPACSLSGDETEQMLPLLPASLCPEYEYELISVDTPLPVDVALQLVGLSGDEATVCAASLNWAFRVAAQDGESNYLTTDYVANRVNVTLQKGIVTDVTVG